MVIAYVPAFTVFLFIEIVKPGPTVPVSVFVFVAADVEPASASVARIVVRPPVISRMGAPLVRREDAVCHNSVATRLGEAHRDEPQVVTAASRQQRFRAPGMCSVRAASDHGWDMLGRRSLPLLAALPLAVVALAGCG